LEILLFNLRIVKVVKVVNDADRVPIGQQGLNQVRTYKPGATGDQCLHIAKGPNLGGKGDKCKAKPERSTFNVRRLAFAELPVNAKRRTVNVFFPC